MTKCTCCSRILSAIAVSFVRSSNNDYTRRQWQADHSIVDAARQLWNCFSQSVYTDTSTLLYCWYIYPRVIYVAKPTASLKCQRFWWNTLSVLSVHRRLRVVWLFRGRCTRPFPRTNSSCMLGCLRCLSVSTSVCPSRSGILSKRLNIKSS